MFEQTAGDIRNIVLVHGGFVDGSGWEGVYRSLRQQGYNVAITQHPTTSLADDVRAVRSVLAAQDGPAVLVGHSYGGAVISEAGTDPKVAALVYIAAFAPDAGESVATLIANPAPGAPVPPSCRRATATCCSTGRSSPPRSPRTSTRSWRHSWPMRSSPGGWRPCRASSPSRRGRPSRPGIS